MKRSIRISSLTVPLAVILLGAATLPAGATAAPKGSLAVRSVLAARARRRGQRSRWRCAWPGPAHPGERRVLPLQRPPAGPRGRPPRRRRARLRRRDARAEDRCDAADPGGPGAGAYRLIACIRASCRAANTPLRVGATPVGTRELVAAAVAAHRLAPQQGLVYRVFAALGDPRLPAAYRADESEPEELVMRDVVSQWATLSPSQKATLLPYFTPPAAKQSAWARRTGRAASVRPLPLVQPACDTDQAVGKDWLTIAKPGGHVRIWWLKDNDKQVGPRARSLLTDVENYMWPRLVAIFGREPLRDGHERCFTASTTSSTSTCGPSHARAMTPPLPARLFRKPRLHRVRLPLEPANPLGDRPRAHTRVAVRVRLRGPVLELHQLGRGHRHLGSRVPLSTGRRRALLSLVPP